VARETATLDRLSGGRLTHGVGLGSDRFGSDFSITGEELDERRRARMLDESHEILTAAWSGEPVHHRGEPYMVEGMRFLPRPVQRPGVLVWVAGSYGRLRPLRRAARYQEFVPVDLEHPDQLAEMVADLAALRREAGTAATEPYDIVAALPVGMTQSPTAPPVRPGGWPSLRLTPSRSIECIRSFRTDQSHTCKRRLLPAAPDRHSDRA
jgi:alkanesulfonate monooxygenase SsuD/methylene tetrahydromethanopterin reductase-like flavin-dependent oxidoreductase (luciferase family)